MRGSLTLIATAKILETLMHYCKSFSENIGHEFTVSTIRLSALTGSAAVDVGGDTAAKQFGMRNKSDSVQPADIELYKDTRLNIVDEVSFACFDKDLTKLEIHGPFI
jgi:hypothetical protein